MYLIFHFQIVLNTCLHKNCIFDVPLEVCIYVYTVLAEYVGLYVRTSEVQ